MTIAVVVFLIGGAFVEFWWFALGLALACWAFCNRPGLGSFVLVIIATAALYAVNAAPPFSRARLAEIEGPTVGSAAATLSVCLRGAAEPGRVARRTPRLRW